jgi:cytochrome P450
MANMPSPTASSTPRDYSWPSEELMECPYSFYDALRHEGVYKYPGRNEYMVSSWDEIVYVCEHPKIFRQPGPEMYGEGAPGTVPATAPDTDPNARRYTPQSMAGSDPPEHSAKRAIGRKFISRTQLRSYEPIARRHADRLIDRFIDDGTVELHSQFADPLPILVICEILGLPLEDFELFARWGKLDGPAAFRFMDDEEVSRQLSYGGEAVAYMERAIQDRVENPRDDFLSELIKIQLERDGELALDYINAEANLMLYAGNVTTTHMITSAMKLLVDTPGQMPRVLDDRSLIRPLVDEALRAESPVQWLNRTAAVDTELGGVPIPAGSLVLIMLASGNRDEQRWGDDAAEFCVGRRDVAKHHLAFGRGIHRCLGAPLATLEGRIAFEQLLSRLKHIRPVPPENGSRHIHSLIFRAPQALQLTFEKA